EGGDFATLVGANNVVAQVDNDADQGWVGLEDLNLNDLGNVQLCSQRSASLVQSAAHLVFQQQHVGDDVGGGVELRGAGTLVVATLTNQVLDHGCGVDTVGHDVLVGVELVVVGDRAD